MSILPSCYRHVADGGDKSNAHASVGVALFRLFRKRIFRFRVIRSMDNDIGMSAIRANAVAYDLLPPCIPDIRQNAMTEFTAASIFDHRVISSLDTNPNSSRAVFVVKRADRDKDYYRSTLWLVDNQKARRIVESNFKPASPRLSPNGDRVAFIAETENGDAEVRLYAFDGADSRNIGASSKTLQSIQAWSPDGGRLLVTHKIAWKEDEFDDPGQGSSRPRIANFLPYKKDGAGIRAGYRIHAMTLDLATGKQGPLLQGDFDVHQAAWSPDGKRLAFIRTRRGAQRHGTDVWLADADGNNARQLTHDLIAVNAFAWSPDSRRLALVASEIEGDSIAELWLCDATSGEVKRAARSELHLESGTPVWHADGERIAVVAAMCGLHKVAVVDASSGEVSFATDGLRHAKEFKASRDGLFFVAASMRTLDELFRVDWNGDNERRLTKFNRRWFARMNRPRAIKRKFRVPDGHGGSETVDAWLLLPSRKEPPYPALVDMHGGPQSVALIDFANHAYWYQLVSLGWMIVAPNCVGSGSYGSEFARRLRGRWGELDLPQHVEIVRQLVDEGLASGRAACAGKSYGGYLAAWALGHTDIFGSVVISAPVANVESHTGTSDSGYYVGPYAMNCELTENREQYRSLSPIECCAVGEAAVLLLQGEDDERCPLGQAEEIFAHLIRCGKTAQMVVYPGGSHSVAASGKPSHRFDYHRRLAAWVSREQSAGEGVAQHDPRESAATMQRREPSEAEAGVAREETGSRIAAQ
jgi:dipeptidyl aminopeptidase/acylaminoacyl peptidase